MEIRGKIISVIDYVFTALVIIATVVCSMIFWITAMFYIGEWISGGVMDTDSGLYVFGCGVGFFTGMFFMFVLPFVDWIRTGAFPSDYFFLWAITVLGLIFLDKKGLIEK